MAFSIDLAGKTALVTGASGGLGAHFARTLATAGARVVLAARRVDKLEEVAAGIVSSGGAAFTVACDVTRKASVEAALDAAEAAAGVITILVNNSGIAIPKRLVEHTEEDWDNVVDTNLKGAWLMAQSFSRRALAAERPGRIINIASILGLRAIAQLPSYAASKAGLIHLTHVMALELGRNGITVNAIAPGYFATEMNDTFLTSPPGEALRKRVPMQRFGQMPDLDGALLLLASDAGAYITGAVIPVDGGHLVSAL